MMLKKCMIAVTILIAPIAAKAADLPVKAPVGMPAPVADWTGLYFGAIGSWVQNRGGATETSRSFEGDCSSCDNLQRVLFVTAGSQDYNAKGLGLGGTLGYNFRVPSSAFVVGIEGDISYLGVKGSKETSNGGLIGAYAPSPYLCSGFDPGCYATTSTVNSQSQVSWMGTLRARGGYLVTPSTLIFVTGGLAFGQVEASMNIHGTTTLGCGFSIGISSIDCPFATENNPFGNIASRSEFKTGFAVGGGIEQKFGQNWSVKAEYLYYDLGSMSLSNTVQGINAWACCGNYGQITKTNSYSFKGDWVRVGLNYQIPY